ncbi:MAG: hypothetical protein ABR899_08000, partial [Candidatus Krumholzibacteriaceae bacterium]
MTRLITIVLLIAVLGAFGCSNSTTSPGNLKLKTLLGGLEYPKGLWIVGDKVYFTEVNGRYTPYGGKVALSVYDQAAVSTTVIINNPENSDAVVVMEDGTMYLTSWHGAIPGNFGKVSMVDPVTHVESQVTDLQIASNDMYLESDSDIVVVGESNDVNANSMYILPSGSYGSPSVFHSGLGISKCVSEAQGVVYYSDYYDIKRYI